MTLPTSDTPDVSHKAPTPTPLAATAQHIRLLQEKRVKLANALVDAELQYLAALRREYDAHQLTMTDLRDAYDLLSAGKIPGVASRWNEAIPVAPAKARAHAAQEPSAEDGTWRGTWPLTAGEPAPLNGRPVVYILFDTAHTPVYVGSSERFRTRLAAHERDGKVFSNWIAHPCHDREHAYEVEDRFLRQYMPALNVRGPRAQGGAA